MKKKGLREIIDLAKVTQLVCSRAKLQSPAPPALKAILPSVRPGLSPLLWSGLENNTSLENPCFQMPDLSVLGHLLSMLSPAVLSEA